MPPGLLPDLVKKKLNQIHLKKLQSQSLFGQSDYDYERSASSEEKEAVALSRVRLWHKLEATASFCEMMAAVLRRTAQKAFFLLLTGNPQGDEVHQAPPNRKVLCCHQLDPQAVKKYGCSALNVTDIQYVCPLTFQVYFDWASSLQTLPLGSFPVGQAYFLWPISLDIGTKHTEKGTASISMCFSNSLLLIFAMVKPCFESSACLQNENMHQSAREKLARLQSSANQTMMMFYSKLACEYKYGLCGILANWWESAGGSCLKIKKKTKNTVETDCLNHSALALAVSVSLGGSSVWKQRVAVFQ